MKLVQKGHRVQMALEVTSVYLANPENRESEVYPDLKVSQGPRESEDWRASVASQDFKDHRA